VSSQRRKGSSCVRTAAHKSRGHEAETCANGAAGGLITELLKNKLNMADRAKPPFEDKKVTSGKWW
jgi:hypothetical protein